MTPRLLLFLLLSAASAAAGLPSAAPVKKVAPAIVRTITGWRDGASFKRISEYFDGRENTGGGTILRTHPEQRTGYYFLLRVVNPDAPLKVQFQVQLIGQGAPVQRTTIFPAEVGSGSGVFHLGLTGPEWQDPKSQPIAWQLLVIATDDGRVLTSEKSYLWEKPETK